MDEVLGRAGIVVLGVVGLIVGAIVLGAILENLDKIIFGFVALVAGVLLCWGLIYLVAWIFTGQGFQ